MSDNPKVAAMVREYYGAAAWVNKKVGGLTEEELLYRPNGDRSNIYWLFGHIVEGSDIACFITGGERIVGPEYFTLFDMGTKPQDTAEGYPPIAEMLETFTRCLDNSVEAIKSLTDADLDKPPVRELAEAIREYFPTRGDIITGFSHHTVYHAGQIGMIMKMVGK